MSAVFAPNPQTQQEIYVGKQVEVRGSRFRGISEASGGGTQNSATNYPLVQLRRIDNGQTLFLPPGADFTDTSFTSSTLGRFPEGPALLTVFTNGIPSASSPVTSGLQQQTEGVPDVLLNVVDYAGNTVIAARGRVSIGKGTELCGFVSSSGADLGKNGTFCERSQVDTEAFPYDFINSFQVAEPGTETVKVKKNEVETLSPGSYGDVIVRGELNLSGGVYHFRSMKIRAGGKVVIEDRSEIQIQGKLKVGREGFLGPAVGVKPREIIVYVEGDVRVKSNSTVEANIHAQGKIRFRSEVHATGSFIGETFKSGKKGVFEEQSFHHSFGL